VTVIATPLIWPSFSNGDVLFLFSHTRRAEIKMGFPGIQRTFSTFLLYDNYPGEKGGVGTYVVGLMAVTDRKPVSDTQQETGKVRVCGDLTLDYVPVTVVAEIELPSMQGEGHLEIRSETQTG
jgi:hypothetical protein